MAHWRDMMSLSFTRGHKCLEREAAHEVLLYVHLFAVSVVTLGFGDGAVLHESTFHTSSLGQQM
jgi:hypothetical protein